MDYADYLNNQIQEQYELADAMERAGCETYEEYIDCLADEEAHYYESHYDI